MFSGSLVMPEIGSVLIGEYSHVVVDNELVVIGIEQMAAADTLVSSVLQGKDSLGGSGGNNN